MAERLGQFLYGIAVVVAVLIGLLGVLLLTGNENGKIVGVFIFIVAGLVYLLGRGIRYVLSGY